MPGMNVWTKPELIETKCKQPTNKLDLTEGPEAGPDPVNRQGVPQGYIVGPLSFWVFWVETTSLLLGEEPLTSAHK